MFDLIRQLVLPYGPSGRETAIADTIEALCAPYAQVSRDALGNVIAHKPGPGRRVMIAAHMDTLGLVATFVDEDGFVRFGTLGGVNLAAALHQRVRFESGVMGVVRADNGTAAKDLAADKCYIDTCGQPVRLGEVAVFTGEPEQVGDLVVSPYLDNRVGCAIAVELLRRSAQAQADLYVVFTVQEEEKSRYHIDNGDGKGYADLPRVDGGKVHGKGLLRGVGQKDDGLFHHVPVVHENKYCY